MADNKRRELSRRDALKLLGAAAGASVLANLPSRWSTPELTAGVLPAHAQTSCFDLRIDFVATGEVGAYVELQPPDSGSSFPGGIGETGSWLWNCGSLETTCILLALTYTPPAEGSVDFTITERDGTQSLYTASTESGYPVVTFHSEDGSVTPGCGP
jgi:hypothetical protein